MESGNDAIDISGSQVVIRNSRITGAGDKAISVGEKSLLEAERVDIGQSKIGIAVKDGSDFTGTTINVREYQAGPRRIQQKI